MLGRRAVALLLYIITRLPPPWPPLASVLWFGALCFCVLASPAGRVFCVFVFGLARLRAVFCVFVFWGPCRVMLQDTYMYMYLWGSSEE